MTDPSSSDERNFSDTPSGWASRWRMELSASEEWLKKAHREADVSTKRFLDKREAGNEKDVRMNVYTANVQTLEAMLYGKTPKVDVSRKFSDFNDAGARIGGEMLERQLNTDIDRGTDTYAATVWSAVQDHLRGGLGVGRLRYRVEFLATEAQPEQTGPSGEVLAPEVEAGEMKDSETEDVETAYVHWRDYRYSPCRTWAECRWVAFREFLSREQCIETFGEKIGSSMNVQKGSKGGDPTPGETDARKSDPWARAEVWEIWDKEHKGVWFYTKGKRVVIVPAGVDAEKNGMVPDPLELEGFFPMPRPLIANTTTDACLPRSDYALVQDGYNELDRINTRISKLTAAMRLAGVYDKAAGESIGRLINDAMEAELIAVDGWAKFIEKGGVKGSIDWLPLDAIAAAIDKLRELKREKKQEVDEISGMGDIIRGEGEANTTATQDAIVAKFGSVRMQKRQDEIARFASDLQRIRAEIICKKFDDTTIIQRSNMQRVVQNPMDLQAGLQCLRDKFREYRIEVKPESISLTDYAAEKSKRTEVLTALATWFQGMIPAIQAIGAAGPGAVQAFMQFAFRSAQWLVAGMRGAGEIEAAFDEFMTSAQKIAAQAAAQPPAQPASDPKLQAAQVKAGAEQLKARMGVVQSVVDLHAHTAKAQVDIAKAGQEMQHAHMKHAMSMQSMEQQARTEALQGMNAATAGPGAGDIG